MYSTISWRVGSGFLRKSADAGHDHAAGAVAALHGAGVEEGLLERVQLAVLLEALDGGDLAGGDRAELGDARARRRAVDQHRAGAATALAAAVLGAGQAEVVAEHAEQRPIAIGVDADRLAVDPQFLDVGHGDRPVEDGNGVQEDRLRARIGDAASGRGLRLLQQPPVAHPFLEPGRPGRDRGVISCMPKPWPPRA